LTNAGTRWATQPKCAPKRCWYASEAREAAFNLRTQWDIAHHLQTEVVPLRQFIHDELTLRYNGMLTSVFEVMADSRTRTLSSLAAAEALRDYWLALADVQAVLSRCVARRQRPAAHRCCSRRRCQTRALIAPPFKDLYEPT